jgi:hypothetical protein
MYQHQVATDAHDGDDQKHIKARTLIARRIDYLAYRARGLQIGSGAMGSLHRTGSQVRLKRPGAKWPAKNAQAIFRRSRPPAGKVYIISRCRETRARAPSGMGATEPLAACGKSLHNFPVSAIFPVLSGLSVIRRIAGRSTYPPRSYLVHGGTEGATPQTA